MDLLTALFDFKAMGIEVATGAMFVTLFLLLITGMPLAFVTLLVALIFALGWFGPMAVPLITDALGWSALWYFMLCSTVISCLLMIPKIKQELAGEEASAPTPKNGTGYATISTAEQKA